MCFRICLVRSLEYTEENLQPVKEQVKTVFLLLFPFTTLTTVCKTSPFLVLLTVVKYFFESEFLTFLVVVLLLLKELTLIAFSSSISILHGSELCFRHLPDTSGGTFESKHASKASYAGN